LAEDAQARRYVLAWLFRQPFCEVSRAPQAGPTLPNFEAIVASRAHKPSELPPTNKDAGSVNVIIETSRGARAKLTFDPSTGLFTVKKMLPVGMSFPFDFGFIPSTTGGDGDPLDVLLLIDEPVPTGVLVPSRLIGVIEAMQTERDGSTEKNDRLIAVAEATELFAEVKSLDDLPGAVVEQIEHFFVSYNAQGGKQFDPTGRGDGRRAQSLLRQAHKRFTQRG
jgi:inorganic pyrophosphatase